MPSSIPLSFDWLTTLPEFVQPQPLPLAVLSIVVVTNLAVMTLHGACMCQRSLGSRMRDCIHERLVAHTLICLWTPYWLLVRTLAVLASYA